MKILVVFIDMVRVDHLHTYNPKAKTSLIDKLLERLGGTVFTRCYSPGPDTPRSLACMQTGLYPHFNGCDTRIKWPKFFVKDEITTIWDHAVIEGWKVNLCCNKNESQIGFFKYKESSHIRHFYTPEEYMKGSDFSDHSISFFGIPDMHTAITDYNATDYAFQKGDEIVNMYFEKFITDEYLSQFDYVVVFSDHGCQMVSESRQMKSTLELLDDGRNQLLMMVHKKGEKGITKDERLASITDLFATLEGLIGCSDFRQGYSLLDKPCRSITHVEDHQDFKVYPEIMIKQWRVISNAFDIRTDVKSTIIDKGTEQDLENVTSYLLEYSPHYADYRKQLKVWDYYDTFKEDENNDNKYFIGVERPSKRSLFWTFVFLKFKRLLCGRR